jgi:hypothetical protein
MGVCEVKDDITRLNSSDALRMECQTFAERMMERYGAIAAVVDVQTPTSVCERGVRVWRGCPMTAYGMAKRFVVETEAYWRVKDEADAKRTMEDDG